MLCKRLFWHDYQVFHHRKDSSRLNLPIPNTHISIRYLKVLEVRSHKCGSWLLMYSMYMGSNDSSTEWSAKKSRHG